MTRLEAITTINDLAWRLIDLLEDKGIDDTSPATIAYQALKALGATPSEMDGAAPTSPPVQLTRPF